MDISETSPSDPMLEDTVDNIDDVENVDRIGICLTRREDISCAVQIHFGISLDYEGGSKPIDTKISEERMSLGDAEEEDELCEDTEKNITDDFNDTDSRIEHPLFYQTKEDDDAVEDGAATQVAFDAPALLPKSVSETDLNELINEGRVFGRDAFETDLGPDDGDALLMHLKLEHTSHLSSVAEDIFELPCEACDPEATAASATIVSELTSAAVEIARAVPEYSASAPANIPQSMEMGTEFIGGTISEVKDDITTPYDASTSVAKEDDFDNYQSDTLGMTTDMDTTLPVDEYGSKLQDEAGTVTADEDTTKQEAKSEVMMITNDEMTNLDEYFHEPETPATVDVDTIVPGGIQDDNLHDKSEMEADLDIAEPIGLPSDRLSEVDDQDTTAIKYETLIESPKIIGKNVLAVPGVTEKIKTLLEKHRCITAEMLLGHYLVRCKNQRKFVTWFVQVTDDKIAGTIVFTCLQDWCKKYI